jgi:flagellar biosynthesis/type III secretory pathway protein FliH
LQKWCLEPLTSVSPSPPEVERPGLFERTEGDGTPRSRRFLKDGAALAADDPLASLTPQVREHLEARLRAELAADFERRQQQRREDHQNQLRRWCEEFARAADAARQESLQNLAQETAALALAVAEKIVRGQAIIDPQVLTRVLETVFYKLDASSQMVVTVNPDDAAYLETQPDLQRRLRIAGVRSDRRIVRGGCLVASERQEWDATLQGQLNAIGGLVQEILVCDGTSKDGKDAGQTPVA